MSYLDEVMHDIGLPIFEEKFGDACVYTDPDGNETDTWVILSKDSEYIGEYDDRIELSDVAKMPVEDIAIPVNGAKILVKGVSYSVGKIIKASKYFTKFYIKKI